MTAQSTVPPQSAPAQRRRPLPRWWWALAAIGLAPTLIPTLTLVGAVVTGDAVSSVPASRLAELMANTLLLAAAVTATSVAIGLGTSWVTTRTDLPGARFFSILVTLPLVMPSYVVALTLLGAGGTRGVITELFGLETFPILTGFWGSWLALTVFAVPFVHLGAVPAIRTLDTSLEEAARGLGSLYAHANEMTMEEAGGIHMEWTPRGWMKTEPWLLIFEQHLYLRQPGYGTSYVTGKYLLEETLMDYAKQVEDRGEPFELRHFFDKLNAIDSIPISLARWEMTGLDDQVSR